MNEFPPICGNDCAQPVVTAKSHHRDRNHFPCQVARLYCRETLNPLLPTVIEISLEKRCLHIDPITGAIAQAAYSRSAMKPELMERLEQLSAPYAPCNPGRFTPIPFMPWCVATVSRLPFIPWRKSLSGLLTSAMDSFSYRAINPCSTYGQNTNPSAPTKALSPRSEKPVWD